ncbi:uncharacterized protein [Diadema setosum]|uniref:uncharacterized protein n=1 Tax=Diadema setosum TaxID=31175 RepID=UPI003B3A6779
MTDADCQTTGSGDVSIEDIRSWWKVPAIAHFCSLFRSTFALPDYEIEELEEALFLDAGHESTPFLPNLLVALLRGCFSKKDITLSTYDQYLREFMKQHWEMVEGRVNPLNLEDATFKGLPTLTKVEILHSLCDFRLDAVDVSVLKEYSGDQLRVEPLGTDQKGAKYWYFYSTRLYKEDPAPSMEQREAARKKKEKEQKKKKKEKEVAKKKRLRETVKARKALEKRLAKKGLKKAKKPLLVKSDGDTCSDDNIPLTHLRKKKQSESEKEKTTKEEKPPAGRLKGKRKLEEVVAEKEPEIEEVNENGKRTKKMPAKKNAKKVKKEEIKKEESGSDADSESEEDGSNSSNKAKKKEKKKRKVAKREDLGTETECDEEDVKTKKGVILKAKVRLKKEPLLSSADSQNDGETKKGKKTKGKIGKGDATKKVKEETATSADSEMEMGKGKRARGKVKSDKGKQGKEANLKAEHSQEETESEKTKGQRAKKGKGKKATVTNSESEGEVAKDKAKDGKNVKRKLKKESSVEHQSGSEMDSSKNKKGQKKKVKKENMSQDEDKEGVASNAKSNRKKDTAKKSESGDEQEGKPRKRRVKRREIKSKEIITETESDTADETLPKGKVDPVQEKGKETTREEKATASGPVTRRSTPQKLKKQASVESQSDRDMEGKGPKGKRKESKKAKGKNATGTNSQTEEEGEINKTKAGSKKAKMSAKAVKPKPSKKPAKASSQESQEEPEASQDEHTGASKTAKGSSKARQTSKAKTAAKKDSKACRNSSRSPAKASQEGADTSVQSSQEEPSSKTATKGRKAPAKKGATPKAAPKKSSKVSSQESDGEEKEALRELQALLLLEKMLSVESDDSSSSSEEEEPETCRWHLVCHTEEDWHRLAESFKKSRNKCERELYLVLTEDFLDDIHNIFAAKERALRRKLQEMVPRRTSGRIADLKVKQEEEARLKVLAQCEEAAKAEAAEASRKISLRRRNRRQGEYAENEDEEEEEEDDEDDDDEEEVAENGEDERKDGEEEEEEDEEEEKVKSEEKAAAEKYDQQRRERSMRARLRAKNASPELSDDPNSSSAVPYDLGIGRTTRSSRSQVQAEQEKEKLRNSFAKVLETTKSHHEAWPFIEPVQESYAPNYYSIIKAPMDIATMDLKVEEKMYHSVNEFVSDMDLIFQNCVQYNGRKSEYTMMARKVEACFRRALKKQFPNFRKKNANCRGPPVSKPVFTDSQDEEETDSQSSHDGRMRKKVKEDEDNTSANKEHPSSSPSPCASPASYHSEDYVDIKRCKRGAKGSSKWKPDIKDENDGDDEGGNDSDEDTDGDMRGVKDILVKGKGVSSSREKLLAGDEDDEGSINKKNSSVPGAVVGESASNAVAGSLSSSAGTGAASTGPVEKTFMGEPRGGQGYMPTSSARYMENVDKPRAHVPPMVGTPLRQSTVGHLNNQTKSLQDRETAGDRSRTHGTAGNEERNAQFSPHPKVTNASSAPVQDVSGQPHSDRGLDKNVYADKHLTQTGVHHGVAQGPEPLAVQPVAERNTAVQSNTNQGSYQGMIDLNARRPPPLQSQWYSPPNEQSNKPNSATQAVPPLKAGVPQVAQEVQGPLTQGSSLQPQVTGNLDQRTHENIPMHSSSGYSSNQHQMHPHSQVPPGNHSQSHSHHYPPLHGTGVPTHSIGASSPWGVPPRDVEQQQPTKLWHPLAVDSPSGGSHGQPNIGEKVQSPPQIPHVTQSSNQPSTVPSSAGQQEAPISGSLQRLASQGSPNAHHGSSTTATELLRSMASPTRSVGDPLRPSSDATASNIQPKPLTDSNSRPGSSFRIPSHSPMPSAIPSGYAGYSGLSTQHVPTPGLPSHFGGPNSSGMENPTYQGYSGQVLPGRKDIPYDPMRAGHTSPFPTTVNPKGDIFNSTGRLTPGSSIHPLSSHRSSAFNQPQPSLYASQLHHPIPASQTLPSSYPGLSNPSHLRTLLQGRQGPIPDPMGRMGQSDMGMLGRNPYLEQSAYGSAIAPGMDPRYTPSMYPQQYNPSLSQQPAATSMTYQVGSGNSYFPSQSPHPQGYHSLNPSHVPGFRR